MGALGATLQTEGLPKSLKPGKLPGEISSKPKTPNGIIGIFTWPDGRVLASASDFDEFHPGGFKVREAQAYRVKQKIRYEVAKALCSDVFVKCISDYHLQDIINEMIRKEDFKMQLIEVPEHKEIDI